VHQSARQVRSRARIRVRLPDDGKTRQAVVVNDRMERDYRYQARALKRASGATSFEG
jgi:hypothetical protein